MAKLKGSSILEVLIAMTIVVISMVLSIRILIGVNSSTLGWKNMNDTLKARRMVNESYIDEGCFYSLPYKSELNEQMITENSRLLSVTSQKGVLLYQKVNFDEE